MKASRGFYVPPLPEGWRVFRRYSLVDDNPILVSPLAEVRACFFRRQGTWRAYSDRTFPHPVISPGDWKAFFQKETRRVAWISDYAPRLTEVLRGFKPPVVVLIRHWNGWFRARPVGWADPRTCPRIFGKSHYLRCADARALNQLVGSRAVTPEEAAQRIENAIWRVVLDHILRACRRADSFSRWRRVARSHRGRGHFFAGQFPLGWKELRAEQDFLYSPHWRVPWHGPELWADRYNPGGRALSEPGIHAWSFWNFLLERDLDLNDDPPAMALVAPLGHVTLGEVSWRAQGAALLRLWAPVPDEVCEHYRSLYQVPVVRTRWPRETALAWAARCLERGELIAPELMEEF